MSLRMMLLTRWYAGATLDQLAVHEWACRPLALYPPEVVVVRGPWRSEVVR